MTSYTKPVCYSVIKSGFIRLRLVKALILAGLFLFMSSHLWAQLTATIGGTTTVCQDAAYPEVTFTGSFGTGPYIFTYSINGGGLLTVSSTLIDSFAIVSVPTEVADTFTYTVIGVSDLNDTTLVSGSAEVTVNEIPAVPTVESTVQPTCGAPTGTIVFTTQAGVDYSVGAGYQVSTTFADLSPATYTLSVRSLSDNTCITAAISTVTINAAPAAPAAAGPITGPLTFTPGATEVAYLVSAIANATSYIWTYTGTGVTINGSGNSITLDFFINATGGQLKVKGNNTCGDGAESFINITPGNKTLNLTVYFEGLYNGSNGLVKVQGCVDGENPFDMFTGTVADTLTVQLAQIVDPYTIVHTVHGVPVNTDGTISLNDIPAALSGDYYIVIKHRNHVETWSQSTSFASPVINYTFINAISKAWGDNMIRIGSIYCLYTGDANKDQYVDGFDVAKVFNLNKQSSFGYQISDVNGDGFINGFDLAKVLYNNKKGVGMDTPIAPLD